MILPTEAVVWLSVVAAVVETKSVSTVSKILPAHLRVNDSVDDILTHPAFAGFGRLLLPWDDHRYDTTMLLRNIGSLLPYHTHVDPAIVVSSLNRMIDDASAGRTVFHDFYTDAEKQADPSREHTGLFFFRGKPDAPFAVIAPGGGFAYVASLHEGFPYAVEISNRGYKTFVLKYRVGQGGRMATEDLAASLSYILRNASSLGVATTDYSLWGSFAGARMAAAIGSHGTPPFGGSALPKPSALALLYTGHSDLASTEPPTFVAVGDADGIAPPSVMERRVAALTDEVLFGDVWRRPELSPRDRSLLTITVLIATESRRSLPATWAERSTTVYSHAKPPDFSGTWRSTAVGRARFRRSTSTIRCIPRGKSTPQYCALRASASRLPTPTRHEPTR